MDGTSPSVGGNKAAGYNHGIQGSYLERDEKVTAAARRRQPYLITQRSEDIMNTKPFQIISAVIIAMCTVHMDEMAAWADTIEIGTAGIGINTSSPAYSLDVTGDVGVTDALTIGSSTTFLSLDAPNIIFDQPSSADMRVRNDSGGSIVFETDGGTGTRGVVEVQADGDVLLGADSGDVLVENNVCADNISCPSDVASKSEVKSINKSLDRIRALQGVSFEYKNAQGRTRTGFIAQDVAKVFPGAVFELNSGIKGVAYTDLIAPMVEAIKEQQLVIDELRSKIRKLEESPLAVGIHSPAQKMALVE